MIVRMRDTQKCEVLIGDISIKQIPQCNYLGSLVTDAAKYDTET